MGVVELGVQRECSAVASSEHSKRVSRVGCSETSDLFSLFLRG